MTRSQTDDNEPYLSQVIGEQKVVHINEIQFRELAALIDNNSSLVASLNEFKERWIEANESSDPAAFAHVPEEITTLRELLVRNTKDPEAGAIAAKVLLRYLGLR